MKNEFWLCAFMYGSFGSGAATPSPVVSAGGGAGWGAERRAPRCVGLLLDLGQGALSVYDHGYKGWARAGILCDTLGAEDLSWGQCAVLCSGGEHGGPCTGRCRELCWMVLLEPGTVVSIVGRPPPNAG